MRESTSFLTRPKWHRGVVLAVGFEGEIPREIEGGAELEQSEDAGNGQKRGLLLLNRQRQVCCESKYVVVMAQP